LPRSWTSTRVTISAWNSTLSAAFGARAVEREIERVETEMERDRRKREGKS
jgi:hypothetical protein